MKSETFSKNEKENEGDGGGTSSLAQRVARNRVVKDAKVSVSPVEIKKSGPTRMEEKA